MLREPRPNQKPVQGTKDPKKVRFQVKPLEDRIAPRRKFHTDNGNHYGQHK